ncbi:MAG TPA: MFS transporter [Rubrobacter sp.]|nr:MFS transporter [Rubrobacter sp.]
MTGSTSAEVRQQENPTGSSDVSTLLVGLIALCAGVTVSNLYLTQPLLPLVAESLRVGPSQVGFLPTIGQAGYALGILLIVPLGDVLRRKGLLTFVLVGLIVALAGAALAPSLGFLMAATLFVSSLTILPQILVPLASQIAGDEHRGRVLAIIGAMMTCGLFASRSLYGQVGDAFGWRASYVVAAVLSAVVGAVTIFVLPKEKGKEGETYASLLRSLSTLLVEEPTLRKACLLQGTIFATFNMFWTTIVFTLTSSPYGFSTGTAGLFGLFGILSATSAPFVGRLIDRRGPIPTLGACLLVTTCSAVAFLLGGTTILALILGIVLLGVGMQGGMSANQTRVLTIRPEAGSRMNTVFLVLIFVCGAAGGAAGSALYQAGGWPLVCISGIGVSTAGFIAWLILDYRGFRN